MADYGFRISADGVDVKTGADKDMVVTSKYPMFKGNASSSGSLSVPRTGVTQTVTVAHGLGYIPMVQGQWNDQNGSVFNSYFYAFGVYLFNGTEEGLFTATSDATNIYLNFSINDFGLGGANVTMRYTYSIYLDKGKI
jgi:hypothetical protein